MFHDTLYYELSITKHKLDEIMVFIYIWCFFIMKIIFQLQKHDIGCFPFEMQNCMSKNLNFFKNYAFSNSKFQDFL